MKLRSLLRAAIAAAGCGFAMLPAAGEAAVAQQLGGSGYSGTLSSNPRMRRQQLICDPAPTDGSTSVAYNADVVTLSGFAYGPGYTSPLPVPSRGNPAGVPGFVEVIPSDGAPTPRLISLDEFFQDQQTGEPFFFETGYVQVRFRLTGTPGQIDPTQGINPMDGPYTVMDDQAAGGVSTTRGGDPGAGHVDTHRFTFDYRPTTPDAFVASYTIYADPGAHGNAPDFFVDPTNPATSIPAAQIAPVTVAGPLPEPTGLAGAGLAAAGLLLRRRRFS